MILQKKEFMKHFFKLYECKKQRLGKTILYNVKRLCDGGFYAQRSFKTAIAKPVLGAVASTKLDTEQKKKEK